MKNEMISVIIPFYNSEESIKKCTESVMNQTYKNLEIIFINDGSKDRSLSIIKKITQNDDRIKILNKENRGVSSARNDGMKIAQGNYIFFVDSDDFIEKDCLQKLYNAMKKNDSDIVRANFFENKKKKIRFKENLLIECNQTNEKQKIIERTFETYDFNSVWGQLINKRILKNIFFDENLKMAEDFKFNLEIIEKSQRILLIPDFLYNYTKNYKGINYSKDLKKLKKKIVDITNLYSELLLKGYNKNLVFARLLREIIPQFLEIFNYEEKEIKEIIKFVNSEKIFVKIKKEINIKKIKNKKYFFAYKYFLENKWLHLKLYYKFYVKPLKKIRDILKVMYIKI